MTQFDPHKLLIIAFTIGKVFMNFSNFVALQIEHCQIMTRWSILVLSSESTQSLVWAILFQKTIMPSEHVYHCSYNRHNYRRTSLIRTPTDGQN